MNPPRRSVFADRLSEHAAFAAGDDAVFARRGRWADYFRERIGEIFGGQIVLEIGCFDGDLLCRMAAKHPAMAFIGLDWKAKSIFDAAERVAAQGLRNVALLRCRGQEIGRIFAPGELDEILLFHPDPCATPAERQNRLFSPPFLIAAHDVLRDATSTLTLKTDHPGYYAWALALFGHDEPPHFIAARDLAAADLSQADRLLGEPRVRASDLLAAPDRPPADQNLIGRFETTVASSDVWNDPAAQIHVAGRVFANERTYFERRFLQKRQPIYYLQLRKL